MKGHGSAGNGFVIVRRIRDAKEVWNTNTSFDGKVAKTGESDFRTLITDNGYYVDKTALIDRVLTAGKPMYLFTRPRRFGKTLNLSMIEEYLDMRCADGPDVFEGLEIERLRPDDPERNAYPVIHLNLKDLKMPSFKRFKTRMRRIMSEAYREFPELEHSERLDSDEREFFSEVAHGRIDQDGLEQSLRMLTLMVRKEYGKKAVVLIDEYDNAVNEADSAKRRKKILSFLAVFLPSALKDNDSLRFAVITGIMPIAKASIFSGLNNLYTDNVFDSRFGEFWGFTEDEVKRICRDFGDEGRFEEAKEWYDGYTFGGVGVYNPWSILCYADNDFKPLAYWVNTSTESILHRLYRGADLTVLKTLLDLGGEGITMQLSPCITFKKTEDTERSFYSVMAMTGYLNAVRVEGNTFRVSVPNREVGQLIEEELESAIRIDQELYTAFCGAVLDGDTAMMEDLLGRILLEDSYWNLKGEDSYALVLTAVLFGISRQYRIRTEQEGGNGRMDILMEARRPGLCNMIFELKKVDSEKKLKPAARKGLEQIHDRRYYLGMEGTVLLYGISFWGKVPCMEHDRVELPRSDRSVRRKRRTTPYIP